MRFTTWQLLIICAGIAVMLLSLGGCASTMTHDDTAAMCILDCVERSR